MTIRWSSEAADDFDNIIRYIYEHNHSAAERVANQIYERVTALAEFPNRGRSGRVVGTRELVLAPLPLIVVYRLLNDAVEIARVLHGSQRWP